MVGLKRRTRPLLGVDIGSTAVKVVELQRDRGEVRATTVLCAEVEPETVVDGQIVDAGAMAATLAQLRKSGASAKHVATAVGGHSVIVKKVTMPSLTDEELELRLQAEAEQYIPFEMSEVNLDYQILDVDENGSMEVLLVAVKREKVNNYTNACNLAGLSVRIMDHDPFAVQNCFEYNYRPDPKRTLALVNLGASVTNLNVIEGGRPQFTRDVAIAGQQFTEALQHELGLSFADAEAEKLAYQGGRDGRAAPVLQSVMETMQVEFRKTFDFFRAGGGRAVEEIYLSGGCARLPGIADMLHDEFSVPVEVLNPFQRIAVSDRNDAANGVVANGPRLAVAVGLALRSFEDL